MTVSQHQQLLLLASELLLLSVSIPTLASQPSKANVHTPVNQTDILLTFKLRSIRHDPLGTLNNWSPHLHPCFWAGIRCDSLSPMRIVEISLPSSQLGGSISPILSQLPYLTALNLSINKFTGFIPRTLANCSTLAHIDLSNNTLTGSIPSEFGLLSKLVTLNLYYNRLTGSIPSTLANCTGLVQLSLYGNSFVGIIPADIGRLQHLRALELSFNIFYGPVPTSIFTNCTGLTILALSENHLSGHLHRDVGNLWNLERLWIDGNQFFGNIPETLGNLSRLNVLSMYSNNFTGLLPSSLGRLASLSLLFSVSDNFLIGILPPTLGNISNLIILTVRGNRFTGAIPRELSKLRNLQGLFLEDNMFTGGIPSELARCTQLQKLHLSNNLLSGSIPPELGELHLLTSLRLETNMLEGTIPDTLFNLSRLQDLSLGYNIISGPIPSSVANLVNIQSSFSLPHTLLTGTIPSQLGTMMHAQKIDLSHNSLSGQIPDSLAECVGLLELTLSHNLLAGRIPVGLGNLKVLMTLDLAHNLLSGGIPASLADLSALAYLNLSFNNLSGAVPITGIFLNVTSRSFLSNALLCGPLLRVVCPEQSLHSHEKARKRLVIVAVVCMTVATLGSVCWLCPYAASQNGDRIMSTTLPSATWDQIPHLRRYAAYELRKETDGFNAENIIGTGSLSIVYYGLLRNGKNVAIKLFKVENREDSWSSFFQELRTLGAIRHRNLVKILGYCFDTEMTALVLEFMAKGSLENHLYSHESCNLSWQQRLQIAIDVAQAMVYLHYECSKPIVHCDLKPSNILLDSYMNARVTYFGIAQLLANNTTANTSCSTLKGSFGYIPPEYALSLRVTRKSDVYSYGITILELLFRKRPTDPIFLRTVRSMAECAPCPDSFLQMLDPSLLHIGAAGGEDQLRRLLRLGLRCTGSNPRDRPTMKHVISQLTSFDGDVPSRD